MKLALKIVKSPTIKNERQQILGLFPEKNNQDLYKSTYYVITLKNEKCPGNESKGNKTYQVYF